MSPQTFFFSSSWVKRTFVASTDTLTRNRKSPDSLSISFRQEDLTALSRSLLRTSGPTLLLPPPVGRVGSQPSVPLRVHSQLSRSLPPLCGPGAPGTDVGARGPRSRGDPAGAPRKLSLTPPGSCGTDGVAGVSPWLAASQSLHLSPGTLLVPRPVGTPRPRLPAGAESGVVRRGCRGSAPTKAARDVGDSGLARPGSA